MAAYTEEFYRLSSRCDLLLTEEQQTSKYINGLMYSIQECVALQDVFSVDEAQNKVMKIEKLQNRALPLKGVAERTSSDTRPQQGYTSSERPLACKAIDTSLANSAMTVAPTTKVRRIHMSSPRLASITGVTNQDTGLMSTKRGGSSI